MNDQNPLKCKEKKNMKKKQWITERKETKTRALKKKMKLHICLQLKNVGFE